LTTKQTTTYDVQPIRTITELNDFKWSLKRNCSERDYTLFLIGINTGLRVSDLVKLKVSELLKKKTLKVVEKKTSKVREINLTNIYDEIQQYIKTLPEGCDWMFPSRQGTNHITTTQAYRQLVKAGEGVDIEGIGTHTMRKTFGYHYYQRTNNIAVLMTIFNHTSEAVTKKYIGIRQEEINDSLKDFVL
jgi:integrase